MKVVACRPSVVGIVTLAYYTLELDRPPNGWSRLPELTADARSACEQLHRAGVEVRLVRVIFVPEDDACLCLYRATSEAVVCQAAERAGLAFGRIAHASSARAGSGREEK